MMISSKGTNAHFLLYELFVLFLFIAGLLFSCWFSIYLFILFQLLDIMEGLLAKGGNVVDYHGCEFFPERWFDGVFVVRTNNTVLYDRLSARYIILMIMVL